MPQVILQAQHHKIYNQMTTLQNFQLYIKLQKS